MQVNPQVYPEIPQILSEIVENGGQNFVLSHRDDATFEYLGELKNTLRKSLPVSKILHGNQVQKLWNI